METEMDTETDICPYCQRPILDESSEEPLIDEYHVRYIETELEREQQKNLNLIFGIITPYIHKLK